MKKTTFIIVLLLIVIIGLVGYICYDKGVFGNTKETESVEETKIEEMDRDEAKKLLEKFEISCGNIDSYGESNKFEAAISTLKKPDAEYTCSELLSDELDKWKREGTSYSQSTDKYNLYYCDSDTNGKYGLYSYDRVNEQYKNMFDKTLDKVNNGMYYYVKKYDGFVGLLWGDGTTGPNIDIEEINKATISNNKLVINAYMELLYPDDNDNFTVGDTKVKCSDLMENKEVEKVKQEILDKYLDKVNNYDITFKVKGNNYIFENINKK